MLGARLGAGREAEVYAWGDAVVKLYRPGFLGHRAEAAVLSTLDGRGCAPRLIDVVDHDGRTGLVLERLDGPDMLTLLERKPWRLHRLARELASTQLAVHSVPAPADLPDLRVVLATRIGDVDMPPHLRGHALRVLDGLPDGDRLCHGDYHPGNLLVTADRVMVIDWSAAARGAPDADHARTLLLLRWGNPLPGTPLMSRVVIGVGRSMFTHWYARAYARGIRRPLPSVDAWMVVHAAARLYEGIDAERPTLIGLLDRFWRASAR
jgi:Phosphotransferase enzyme family